MRADFFSLSHSFDPDAGIVGFPRFGRENAFRPGGVLAGLSAKKSFLSQLGRRFDREREQFGLGDHVGVPVTQLEAQFTSSLANAVEGLVSRAHSVRSAAEALVSGSEGGVFDRRTASSSTSAVAVTAKEAATVAGYAVDVTQLAVAQQNAGSQLLTTLSPSDIAAGLHSFGITVDGVTTTVNVTVPAGTNLDALSAIKNAVNEAGAGVEASIVSDRDVSQLVLTAAQTGTDKGFTVADVVGSVVATTGVETATRSAADALVTVNGVDHELAENKLALDAETAAGTERVTLYFQAVTTQTAQVDVSVAVSADEVVAATSRLVGAVNRLREFVTDKPQILSSGLLARLKLAVEDLRESLGSVGVQVEDEGRIDLDEKRLRGALAERPADVERAIGSIQGLAARERSVAETLLGSESLAFATKPGPLGDEYGRTLRETVRLHNYIYGGLFVNLLV
ncbi:MAG TPA: flagellin hook IN motif-containing protein [Chloroflexota bacterium]|nr:flagellin hook IN motif-containing protein [Chloroflexota bacterium]